MPDLVTDFDSEGELEDESDRKREQNKSDSEYEDARDDNAMESEMAPVDHRLRSPEDWPETQTYVGAWVASILD